MRSDVCFLQFIPSCMCDFQRLNNSWGKIISIKGSHALGLGCGIRFSFLSALLCLAAGWITSNLHLDSDILMMNYALLFPSFRFSSLPVAAAVHPLFRSNVSLLGLTQGSELTVKKYCFQASHEHLPLHVISFFHPPPLHRHADSSPVKQTFTLEKHAP